MRCKSDKSFFYFPAERSKATLWCSLIRHQPNSDSLLKNAVFCELHFEPSSIRRTPGSNRKMLLADGLPKFHSWNEWGSKGSASQSTSSSVRCALFTESPVACNNQLTLKEQLDIVRSVKLELSAESKRLKKIIDSKMKIFCAYRKI